MKGINILYFALIVILMSCQDQDPEVDEAKAFPVVGEWYVHEYYEDGSDYGPYHLQIFNTSFDEDSVWVSNIYDDGIVVKTRVTSSKTFDNAEGEDAEGGYGKVAIANSKIVKSDSVYFEVTLYDGDEVDDQFYIAGKRWTGHEDAH
jgi:hypothetical protein